MPGLNLPFMWGEFSAAKNPGMMISIFPDDQTDSGLGNPSSKIEFESKALAFTPLDQIKKPVVPNELTWEEIYFDEAMALAAGVSTAILVLSLV